MSHSLFSSKPGPQRVMVSHRSWRFGCAGRWLLAATLSLVMGVALSVAQGVVDTDGDGLSDTDELNIHATDPTKADTDGDGQPDGHELRAGTDPRAKASLLRILGSPSALPGGGWRVQWSSVPGKSYQLMRWSGEDLAAPGNPRWLEVAKTSATGAIAQADDLSAQASRRRYYRVVLVETAAGDDRIPPVISPVRATPTLAQMEGLVTLAVTAQDTNKVAGVTFYDGANLLGPGIQVDMEEWRFNWPVTFDLNGARSLTAQATDAAGNRATSVPVAFSVNIAAAQAAKTIGQVPIHADRLQTNGAVVVPSGNVRLGIATLASNGTVSLNISQGIVSGNGKVSLPGIGLIFDGAFVVDTATGILSPAPGTTPAPVSITVNSKTVLLPEALKVNLLTGTLEGKGTFTLQTEGRAQPQSLGKSAVITLGAVRIEGDFKTDSGAHSVTVTGKVTYAGVEGAGTVLISLAESTFQLTGEVNIQNAANAEIFNLREASFNMRWNTDRNAEFTIAGKPSLPKLAQLNLALTGTLATTGNLRLSGQVEAAFGGFQFVPLAVSLDRPANAGQNLDLRAGGAVRVQNVLSLALNGRVQSDGSLVELASAAEVNFGNGIRLAPRQDAQGNELPVLRLTGSPNGVSTFEVNGDFQAPAATGAHAVAVTGLLELTQVAGAIQVRSFIATNQALFASLALPGGIELRRASVALSFSGGSYGARLRGDLTVAKTGALVATSIGADLGLQIHADDPKAITIDSDVNFAGVNLRDLAVFTQGQLRVTVQTKPLSGTTSLRNGAAGFFPQDVALANGHIVTNRVLGAADFHLFASNVFANVLFSGGGLDLALTNGVLRLPDRFTTLAAGECALNGDLPNGGTVPSVALTPASALTLRYSFGQTADTATLRFEGGLDFANFGLAIPAAPGQASPAAIKLCSGRLVFRGGELPALENLSGKIRVRDLGAFNLVSGTLDPRGVFAVRANGQATLNGANFNLTNFEASYATNQFKLAASSTLDLGDGIKLEPDDITDPSRPAPPVISASYNRTTQIYELALAGKLKLPDAQYIAMRGRVANGSLSLASQGTVLLGADASFRPISQNGNTIPVLQLESVTQNGVTHLQLALAGELLVPGADGQPHPLAMAGKLRLRVAADGQPEVQSLNAFAALATYDFGGGVRLSALNDPVDTTRKLPIASLVYARPSGYRITFAGEFLAPGIVQRAQLAGAIQNNQLVLASVGQADFGNSFKISPLFDPTNNELPVLKLEVVTIGATTKAGFKIAGSLQVPDANGTPRAIQVTGRLALRVESNGTVRIESFATQAAATSFELGSGLKLEALPDPNNATQRLPVVSAVYGEQSGYEVRLAGKMILAGAGTPQAQYVTLQGRINNSLLELNSFATVHLGNGVWIQPPGANLPVLQLQASQGQQTEAHFAVNGAFLVPADAGATRSVAVGGSLRVGLEGGSTQIKTFMASSATTNDWMLPGPVRLQRAGVTLGYGTNRFTAELNGQLQVGPTTATLDHGILVFEDEADAANIRLNTQVTLRSVPLGEVAFLQVGSARLELATSLTGARPRDAFGRLSLGGSAGLFPIGTLPATPVRTNFNLFVENVGVSARFSSSNLVFSLTNGTLRLPDVFTSGVSNLCAEAGTGATVALGTNTAIEITYSGGLTPSVPADFVLSARGTLKFGNLGFDVPGMPGLAAQLCSATLVFQGNQLPALAGVSGSLRIPVSEQNLQLSIVNGAWKLNGYPSGTIFLAQDFKILDREGFTLTLLGGQSCGANNVATGISIEEGQTLSNPPRPPKFTLHGGLRFAVPESVLRRAVSAVTPNAETPPATQVSVEGCGSVTFFPDRLPDVALDRLSTSGDFILGNSGGAQTARASLEPAAGQSQGISIKGATITLENIGNMFNFTRSPSNPFTITLSGLIAIPSGPAFGLQNTRFVFDNANPRVPLLPRFEPGTLEYQKNEWALVDALPIQVRLARLTFKDGSKELPEILKPDNVKVTFSGGIAIPPNDPYVQGDVNDLEVTFRPDGTPVFSIDGFAVTLKPGTDIPPIEDISGSVFVGGLKEPVNPFFTGRVAGSYQGYKLKFLVAFNLAGFVGMCVDVNAGAVGIPLDTTGFLITGASGGISAANSNGDPCSFQTYMDPVTGRPISSANSLPPGVPPFPVQAMTWTQLRDYAKRFERAAQAYGQSVAADAATVVLPASGSPVARAALRPQATSSPDPLAIPCPGDCPPPTVNIFCQPHPDQAKFPGRIITKFTSIDEVTLNRVFGITEEHIRQLQTSGVTLARIVAHELRVTLDATIPAPDPALLGAARAAQIRQLQVEAFDTMESAYLDAITLTIGNQSAPGILYGLIRDLVYAGLPCADATFRVSGTLSHLAVSSFLSVTGEGTLSTAGTAGIGGTVNLYGLPIGQGKMFVAATDSRGQPNPSICGEINVAFGPLELGWLKAAMQCDECVTGVLNVFGQLVGSLALDTLNNLTAKVAPRFVGSSPQQLAAQLTAVEKTAFIAEILQLPAASLPPDLPQRLINALGASFEALDPRILLCGEVRPRLFGLPLSPELVGASMQVSKTGRDVNMKFSPSFLLALILDPRVMPPIDTAVIGYSEVWPDPAKALLAGLSGSLTPASASKYVEENIQNILQNSTYTINYELCPFGLKIGRAAARVVNPNLLNHPVIRVPAWRRPEDRGLPSRADLLLAAVRANLLGNSLWKGTTNDLANVYPDDASKNQVRGLSLAEDYFPHGGFIGAGYIQLPRFLYDAPVSLYQTMLDPDTDPNQRLRTTATFVLDYLMKNVEAGQLGFYVPAPNPPAFVDAGGRPLKPSELLQGLMKFDVRDIRTPSLYSFDQSFLAGQITGKLLDIPIGQARVIGLPADAGAGRSESILQITANGPTHGWLQQLVTQADLIFEMRQAPPQPIEQWASNSWQHLNNVIGSNPSAATALTTVQTFLSELATNVPKTKLEAAVMLQIPPGLTNLVQIEGNANARLVAYSPQYEPGATGSGPLVEARRKGGIAMQANLKFGPYFSVPNAELSVLPRDNGLPVLAGRFGPTSATLPGGVSMRNVTVDFDSAAPSLTASGSISAIQFGQAFQIVPLAGNDIPAQLQLSNGQSGGFKVGPARLTFNAVFDGATTIRVHGATASDPFTFATSGPWSANLSFEGSDPVQIVAAGQTLLQINRSSLLGAGVSRDELGVTRLKLRLAGRTAYTFLPNLPIRQAFTLNSDTELVIGSDGKFSLDAAVGNQQVGVVGIGGRVALTNDPELSFTLGGTVVLPPLAGFAILPRVEGSPLAGSVQIRRNSGGQLESLLRLKPARFALTSLMDNASAFLIDGGTDTGDFTFSPDGPWSARLTRTGGDTSVVRAGGLAVLQYAESSVQSAGVSRDTAGVARVTVNLRSQSELVAFPGSPVALTFKHSADTILSLGSDGKFLLDAAMEDQPFGQITLQGRARLSNDPVVTFTLGGRVILPPLPGFAILPRVAGSPLEGALEIRANPGSQPSRALRLKPARLTWSTALGSVQSFRLDGGTDAQDFTFSTSDPWSARVTKDDATPLSLMAGSETVLQLMQSQIQSGTVARDAGGVMRLSLMVAGGSTLTAFPGKSFAQSFTLSSATELKIASNGAFSFAGAINDQAAGQITLRGLVSLSNTPALRFSLGGTLTAPTLGGVSILPRVDGGTLEGALLVEASQGGGLAAGIRIKPARLAWSAALGTTKNFLIDGGSDTQDFTFSTTGPWSARVRLDSASPLELRAGNDTVLQLSQAQIQSGTVARDANGVTRLGLMVAGGSTLTAFPGKSFAQSFTLRSATELVVTSDGAFSFNGAINDQAAGQIILRGAVSLSNTPTLRFGLGGTLTVPPLGGISILPRVDGAALEGSLVIERGGDGILAANVRLKPARLRYVAVLGASQTFQIDGGDSNTDFTFSTSGPWSARLTQQGASALDLSAGPVKIASITRGSSLTGTVSRDATGVGHLSFSLNGGTTVTVFPDLAFKQTYRTQSAATLSINSDATFQFTATTGDGLPFTNLPIGTMASGATATLTQNGLALSGSVTGGVLDKVTIAPGVSVTAAINITSGGGPLLSGSASVRVNPLVFGPFSLSPLSGTTFNATLGSGGLAIPAGAQLSFNGRSLGSFSLPTFTIPPSGNFSIKLGPVTCALGPQGQGTFAIENAMFEFSVANGLGSARFTAGSLVVPAPGGTVAARASISGNLNSNGTFSLAGSTAGGFSPAGLPFASLGATAYAVLSQQGLTVEGTVSGGALAVVPITGGASVSARISVTTTGGASLAANVSLTINQLVYGPFTIAPLSGTTFGASLGTSGVTVPSGARLLFNGQTLAAGGLPSFTIPSSGTVDFTAQPASVSLNGFAITSPAFRFQYQKGEAALTFTGGSLQAPLPSSTKPTGFSISGTINTKGDYTLTGSTSGTLALGGLPIPSMNLAGGASVTLKPGGLTLSGNLSGGLLGFVTPAGNVAGTISVATGGGLSLQGSIAVNVQPFHAAPFHVEPVTGTLLSANLSNSGLSFSGARLRVDGIFETTVILPDFSLQTNGEISRTVTVPSMKLGGISCAGLSFTFKRVGNVMSLSPFEANLAISGFSQKLSGSINSQGNMSLVFSGSLTMGGFTAGNGKLTLSNSGLAVEGNYNVKVLDHVFNSSLYVSGSVNNSGNYTLRGSGSFDFGGFKTDTFNVQFNKNLFFRDSGNAPVLDYGGLKVALPSFNVTSTGVTGFNGSQTVDSGWKGFAGVNARLIGTVSLTSASNGNISGSLSSTFYWWFGPTPNNDFKPSEQSHGASGSIGSDGKFFVGDNRGNQNGFNFDLW